MGGSVAPGESIYRDTIVVGGVDFWQQRRNEDLGRPADSGGDMVLVNISGEARDFGVSSSTDKKTGVITWTVTSPGMEAFAFTPEQGKPFSNGYVSVYVPKVGAEFEEIRALKTEIAALEPESSGR